MPSTTAQVTAAEIARFAGVSRATVSNWRRRHPDFPAPTGGTDASPAYDLAAVRAWLAARGQLPADTCVADLRAAVRGDPEAAEPTRLLPLVLAGHKLAAVDLDAVLDLSDTELPRRATALVTESVTYRSDDAAVLRALLRCVRAEGALVAADILAERGVDEPATTGTYRTPTDVADLMADLLAGPGQRFPAEVFDPACGAGGLLAAAARRGAGTLYGQDLLPAQVAQATTRLGLAGGRVRADIRDGDSLRRDAFPELIAAAVLCNPPYGNRGWGQDVLAYDQRWVYGLPPKSEPELAWVQHCLAHLVPGGRAVLLMPPAAAERSSGRRIRAELVRAGALRAVVALPPGAAPPAHIGLNLWLLTRPAEGEPGRERPDAPDTVLFVDATGPGGRGWEEAREAVLGTWSAYRDGVFQAVPSVARVVPVVDLLAGACELAPARHVQSGATALRPAEQSRRLRRHRAELRRAADALIAVTERDDRWPESARRPSTWRTTAVADLLRGGALTLLRAVPVSRAASAGSATAADFTSSRQAGVALRAGDIVLPEQFSRSYRAQVVDAADEGQALRRQHLLLRPDPQRLDSWFLAGFLSAEGNVNAASSGSTIIRVDVRKLRLPVMPLGEQRRYGRAFAQVEQVRAAAEAVTRLAEETADTLTVGLTGGALLPPSEHE